jgi:tRNA(fMet)-specific endonuclease VapC
MSLYVMDTDHLSLYQRGYPSLHDRISATQQNADDDLVITVVSLEEQLAGRLAQIRKATTPQNLITSYAYLRMTYLFLKGFELLDYDTSADNCFQGLRKAGIRIGTQDLRIAAITLVNDGILLTRNRRDFEKVPRLNIDDWST